MIPMKLVKFNEGRLGALVEKDVIDLNFAFAAYKKSKGVTNPQRKADANVPPPSASYTFVVVPALGTAKIIVLPALDISVIS